MSHWEYVITIRCHNPLCPGGFLSQPLLCVASTRRDALNWARVCEWRVNRRNLRALCPPCRQKLEQLEEAMP